MKKILFIAAIALAFMSCEKGWTCQCVGTNHIEGETTDVDYTFEVHTTKKNAPAKCEEGSRHHSVADIDCTLK